MDKQKDKVIYKKTLTEKGSGEFVVNLSKTMHTCYFLLAPCNQCCVEATIDAFGYNNLYG
jgi:hypothetical protein